jgi:hypothetical protein
LTGGLPVWKLVPTADLFHLQSSIVDGISGAVFEPNFNYPADYCTWEDFTTLGICSAYQNLTSEIKMDCDDPKNPLFNCTYTFPDGTGSTIARNITFGDTVNLSISGPSLSDPGSSQRRCKTAVAF